MLNALIKSFSYIVLLLVLSGCSKPKSEVLRIACAANLRFAMEEVNAAFQKKHDLEVEMVTASSGKLTAQIKNAAPFDFFLSANFKYPNSLFKGGLANQKPILFCYGSLVVWTNSQKNIDSNLTFLLKDSIRKIAIANPENAPYGIAAVELLKSLKLYDKIKSKLVFAENVAQLNQYILNKVADVGITAKSAVKSTKLLNVGKWVELSAENYNKIGQYYIVIDEKNSNINTYLEFLKSIDAKHILQKHGYYIK